MCFLGVVTWNWHGEVLKLLTKRDCVIVVEVAKGKEIVLALQLVKNSNWVRVIVESDALLVVKCIDLGQGFSLVHWKCRDYIQDCLTLRNNFNSCSIIWGFRKVNKTAHILCKWATNVGWEGSVSTFCIPFILFKTLFKNYATVVG